MNSPFDGSIFDDDDGSLSAIVESFNSQTKTDAARSVVGATNPDDVVIPTAVSTATQSTSPVVTIVEGVLTDDLRDASSSEQSAGRPPGDSSKPYTSYLGNINAVAETHGLPPVEEYPIRNKAKLIPTRQEVEERTDFAISLRLRGLTEGQFKKFFCDRYKCSRSTALKYLGRARVELRKGIRTDRAEMQAEAKLRLEAIFHDPDAGPRDKIEAQRLLADLFGVAFTEETEEKVQPCIEIIVTSREEAQQFNDLTTVLNSAKTLSRLTDETPRKKKRVAIDPGELDDLFT